MTNRFISPEQQFINNAGQPYAGGQLFFYISGTSTSTPTYQDQGLTIPNTNPVVLDSAGNAGNIFLNSSIVYKVVLEDANSNLIWTFDPVIPTDAPSGTAINAIISCTPSGTANTITLTPINASQQPLAYTNYTVLAFVPALTTTGAVTAQVGSLPLLPVFLTNGVQASANSFVANSGPYFIAYGSTVAGASPGFLLLNQIPATSLAPPQGYLNLVGQASGDVIQTADVIATTTVYYSPFTGNIAPIWNGSSFVNTRFAELTLTLTAIGSPSNTIQDVFLFSNNGAPTLMLGPSWTNVTAGSCARGTGAGTSQLTRLQGLWVNAVSVTGYNGLSSFTVPANQCTYIGSISIDAAAGQVSAYRSFGQSRKFGIWNAYNRQHITMQAGDPAANWNYTTNTIRPSNNSTANSITTFTGLAEEEINVTFNQYVIGGSQTGTTQVIAVWQTGIGWNSVSSFSGQIGGSGGRIDGTGIDLLVNATAAARYVAAPALGINVVTSLERTTQVSGSPTVNYQGTQSNMLLAATYRA